MMGCDNSAVFAYRESEFYLQLNNRQIVTEQNLHLPCIHHNSLKKLLYTICHAAIGQANLTQQHNFEIIL